MAVQHAHQGGAASQRGKDGLDVGDRGPCPGAARALGGQPAGVQAIGGGDRQQPSTRLFRGQFGVVKSWFDAGRPVEFHLYQNGGHGFGLGYPGKTSNGWFPVFLHWLDVNGFLKAEKTE